MIKGCQFWPKPEDWRGAILFIETSEEAPNIDYFRRWIRNYGSQEILQIINGLLFGRAGGADLPAKKREDYETALLSVVREELGLRDLPVFTQVDFGHTDPMFVIPYGATLELDCDHKTLTFTGSGTT